MSMEECRTKKLVLSILLIHWEIYPHMYENLVRDKGDISS